MSDKRRNSPLVVLFAAWLLPGSLLMVVWGLAIRQLELEWTFNPQYQYGWIVPFLTLLLWWRAWSDRPPAGNHVVSWTLPAVTIFIVFLALPMRIIQEANPDWKLLNYYYTAQAILITVLLLDYSGGKSWLRYFIFPLLFPLVAVPWPSGIEQEIIQGLQRIVATIGVEAASWMGWSSYQRGNLIVLSEGTVGVNEACSGIRSLQSCLMIGLFLGEYFQITAFRRVVLLVLAIASAFILNVIRAVILISLMQLHGPASLSRYHDPAGFGIAMCSLLVLWFAATYMTPPEKSAPAVSPETGTLRFPKPLFIALMAAWVMAELLNPLWYRWHEQNVRPGPIWSLEWPLPRSNFKTTEIDESVQTILRYDEGRHGEWNDQDDWSIFFFKWKPSHVASGLAGFHHPDICLPAAGFVMKDNLGIKEMEIRGLKLPVSQYVFENPFSHKLYYVFQVVTNDRVGTEALSPLTSAALDRLQNAWNGNRNLGQRSLLVVNQGAADLSAAELGLQSFAERFAGFLAGSGLD